MSVTTELPIGTEVLGYRIERVLGRGGMGIVYLAEDRRLKRLVALKLLSPRLAEDARFRDRLLAESEVAASLDHPNIVPIYEAGEVDDRIFISMRYVEGSDLRALLREAPLTTGRTLAIVAQLASALDAAHARGLVHRDVKPSNVLIDREAGPGGADHVYLADFGLTKRLSDVDDAASSHGQLLGTVEYVAPEQIRGEEVDGRADLYSLGCLLYECLAGEPPYPRDSASATLFAHLREEPPVLPGLERVLPKALAKSPGERFQTCRELVDAARTALRPEPRAGAVRTRRTVLVVAALLAVAAAALAVGLFTRQEQTTGSLLLANAADSVKRIDQASNDVAATVPVNGEPKGIAVGRGAVWVVSYQKKNETQAVSRIDSASNAVTRTYDARAGFATGVAVGADAVWAIYNRRGPNPHWQLTPDFAESVGLDSIQRLDPGSGSFSTAASYRYGFEDLVAGQRAVWALTSAGTVYRIDSRTGKVAKIPLPSTFPTHKGLLSIDAGGVWVVHGPPKCSPPLTPGTAPDCPGALLTHIDPTADRRTETFRTGFQPAGIASGEGAIWLTDGAHNSVLRLDPVTGLVTTRIGVGRNPIGVAAGAGAVWVANSADGTVSRIDPGSNRVVATVEVGGRPVGVASGRGSTWVAVAAPY